MTRLGVAPSLLTIAAEDVLLCVFRRVLFLEHICRTAVDGDHRNLIPVIIGAK